MCRREVSMNALYHFTKGPQSVASILENGFYPKVTEEDLSAFMPFYKKSKGRAPVVGVPMTCFYDLPLDLTGARMRDCGGYAIGLKKEWGIMLGVAPVHHLIADGEELNALIRSKRYIFDMEKICADRIQESYRKNRKAVENLCGNQEYIRFQKQRVEQKKQEDLLRLEFDTAEHLFCGAGRIKVLRGEEGISSEEIYAEKEWRYLVGFADDEQRSYRRCNRVVPTDARDAKERLNRRLMNGRGVLFEMEDVVCLPIEKHKYRAGLEKEIDKTKRFTDEQKDRLKQLIAVV